MFQSKNHRVTEWIFKNIHIYAAYKRLTLDWLKMKRWKQVFHVSGTGSKRGGNICIRQNRLLNKD